MTGNTAASPEPSNQKQEGSISEVSEKQRTPNQDYRPDPTTEVFHEIHSLTPPLTNDWNNQQLLEYFINGWQLNDMLFSSIKDESTFYLNPDPLRNPLIFYLGHTAAFCINKLKAVGLIEKGIHEEYEKLFEIGVDPEDEDALAPDLEQTQWPDVQSVWEYRRKAFNLICKLIEHTTIHLDITWESPLWAVLMGFEHDRIHFETSTMLFRQLDVDLLERPQAWKYAPMNATNPVNEFIAVKGGTVTLGKRREHPTYGWDNEYGQLELEVKPFQASKYLITNKEFAEFVDAGGYQQQEHWGEHAWQWNTSHSITSPKFWVSTDDGWKYRAMFDVLDMPWDWPAEVNHYEAMAYIRWRNDGSRLLSEAEWNLLSEDHNDQRHTPKNDPMYSDVHNLNMRFHSPSAVGSCTDSKNSQGFADLHGNVWEWLHNDFYPLPGFKTHELYKNFSITFFDTYHAMLLGGSWATTGTGTSKFYRLWFRRYFYQHAGFRIAKDL